jgi:hypothetical protein
MTMHHIDLPEEVVRALRDVWPYEMHEVDGVAISQMLQQVASGRVYVSGKLSKTSAVVGDDALAAWRNMQQNLEYEKYLSLHGVKVLE